MIQGQILRDAIISASNRLSSVKQEVDALNVFPVPDGDTGTNMSMTIAAGARELSRLSEPTVSQVADTASSALLRGARGNSGVILSLLFRGFSKGLKGKTEADGADLANALTLGVDAAYKAVMKPTEGTILTVAREAAAKGVEVAKTNTDPLTVWDAICVEADASLERTPDLLPALKKAGVVDAGGKGFCVIIREMQNLFQGGQLFEGDISADAPQSVKSVSAAAAYDTEITFTYCTEFIVARDKGNDRDPLSLRAYLESIGDCVVVVDDEDIIKVHVHTNDPGKALQEGGKFGQFETVKVENMRLQHENAGWVEEAPGEQVPEFKRAEPENPYGFVAVAAGDGLADLFRDLGCDQVVSGGQTMNPSTDDILNAIQATPAELVYVLPNNKNIILAAEQAVPLADRKVRVLPTRTIPQGISSMLAFDPEASVEDNLLAMRMAYEGVSSGSLTFAARDSDFEGHDIHEGDILAMENGKLSFVDKDVTHAAVKLAKTILTGRRLTGKETNFITVIAGADVSEKDANAVAAAIQEKAGNKVDVTVLMGGQPVYYYYLSIE